MISFEFECWVPVGDVQVYADEFGKHIKVISRETNASVKLERLRDSDRDRILAKIKEKVELFAQAKIKQESHPANDAFGASYVNGLNKDMNK